MCDSNPLSVNIAIISLLVCIRRFGGSALKSSTNLFQLSITLHIYTKDIFNIVVVNIDL